MSLKPYILRGEPAWVSVGLAGCSRTVEVHLPHLIIDKDTASIPAQGEHIYILWVERDRFRINMRGPPIKPIAAAILKERHGYPPITVPLVSPVPIHRG